MSSATLRPTSVSEALTACASDEPGPVPGGADEAREERVRIERARGHELVVQLIEAAPGLVESVSVGKPTLQDVFIRLMDQSQDNVA